MTQVMQMHQICKFSTAKKPGRPREAANHIMWELKLNYVGFIIYPAFVEEIWGIATIEGFLTSHIIYRSMNNTIFLGLVIMQKSQKNVTHPTGDSYIYREKGKSKILLFWRHLGTAQQQFPDVIEGAIFSTNRYRISVKNQGISDNIRELS